MDCTGSEERSSEGVGSNSAFSGIEEETQGKGCTGRRKWKLSMPCSSSKGKAGHFIRLALKG